MIGLNVFSLFWLGWEQIVKHLVTPNVKDKN
jgi:hypothetical protein